jgi:hypothetical protein
MKPKRRKQRKKLIPGHFVPLLTATMATPAWRAMSFGARLVYVGLRAKMYHDARNNGTFYLSCRAAAKALGTKSTRSVVRWLAELEHYGFVRKTGEGFLGLNGRGIAARYCLTEYAHGTNSPTRDFEQWNGELFAYTPRRPVAKNRSRVPQGHTRVPQGYIRRGVQGLVRMCPPGTHRRARQLCPPGTRI